MNRIETLYDFLLKNSFGRKDMLIRAAVKVIANNISPKVVSDYQAVIQLAQIN
jgi:hypothetical protein